MAGFKHKKTPSLPESMVVMQSGVMWEYDDNDGTPMVRRYSDSRKRVDAGTSGADTEAGQMEYRARSQVCIHIDCLITGVNDFLYYELLRCICLLMKVCCGVVIFLVFCYVTVNALRGYDCKISSLVGIEGRLLLALLSVFVFVAALMYSLLV